MTVLVSLFLTFLFTSNSHATLPELTVKKEIDYSNCVPQGYGTMGIPYRLGEKGKEAGHLLPSGLYKHNAKVSSYDGGNIEQFSFQDMFELTGGKTTVVMGRTNGRPNYIQTQYDKNSNIVKGYPDPSDNKKRVPGIWAQGIRFGYEGNKCQVTESFVQYTDGKEVISYSAKLCKDLLGMAKKSTVKKLVECKATFSQMSEAIRKAKDEYKKSGKDLQLIGMGVPGFSKFHSSDNSMDQDFLTLNSLGVCNLNRSMYGLPLDPDTTEWGDAFGSKAFGGASPYGMGGNFGGNSPADTGDAFAPNQKAGEKGAQ